MSGKRDNIWKRQSLVFIWYSGKYLRTWGEGEFPSAHELRVIDGYVWITDLKLQQVFKFDKDGKLLMTLGKKGVAGTGNDEFDAPTDVAFGTNGDFFVADGHNGGGMATGNARIVKFDKDGKFLLAWGQKGNPPNDTRPGYMNNVHGMALDPQTRHVFVNDRANHRIQVFDENGKFLYDFSMGQEPSDIHLIYIGADRSLWAFDRGTSKMLKYDLDGHFLYSFGTWGDFPGGFWGVHGFSTDQDGNFYVAEVDNGRVQKFRPRAGVNPEFLVSKPVYAAWK